MAAWSQARCGPGIGCWSTGGGGCAGVERWWREGEPGGNSVGGMELSSWPQVHICNFCTGAGPHVLHTTAPACGGQHGAHGAGDGLGGGGGGDRSGLQLHTACAFPLLSKSLGSCRQHLELLEYQIGGSHYGQASGDQQGLCHGVQALPA